MERGDGPVLEIARALMGAVSPADLQARIAAASRRALQADWAGVWVLDRRRRSCALEASEPEGLVTAVARWAGRKGDLLAAAVSRREPITRHGAEVAAQEIRHLAAPVEFPIGEVSCVPFTIDAQRAGVLELVWTAEASPEDRAARARTLVACSALASSSAAALGQAEAGREAQLAAINRLMQLYDVAQVFHSTLDRDLLLPIIAGRIGLILQADPCRVWVLPEEGEGLICAHPAGEEGPLRLEPDGAPPWVACRDGEGILVADLQEIGEAAAPAGLYEEGSAASVICAPLVVDEVTLGSVEAVRPPGAPRFTRDDLDFLEELARQATVALRNANLYQAERKAKELDALLDVSREITATLDLDRVLATIVNRADAIVPAERCAILLAEGNTRELRAVSGRLEVDRKDPGLRDLEEILTWAHMSGQGVYVSEIDGEIEADRDETRGKFKRHFERSGMKTFIAFPLKDEEGLLGMLSIESQEPYFVSEEKLEFFNILVNQATVAIRNASLYRRIPLIGLMQPIAGWRGRLRALPRWAGLRAGVLAAAVVAFLGLVPWTLKIPGRVVVLPAKNAAVTAEVDGIIEVVHRREGDRVRKGDLLATLVDRDYRVRAEEARARREIALREVARHEADLDRAAARQARIRSDQYREELDVLSQDLAKTRIVSPVNGVVLTPRLEQRAGALLRKGDPFCRVADMSEVAVEILVREADIGEVAVGQRVRLKIDAFPTETFTARIEIVGQKVIEEAGERSLIVRGRVEGANLSLRTGMVGRAKIEAGRRSVGRVILRRPARFLWRTAWAWLP